MVFCLNDSVYKITYTESEIEKPILWENHCHTQFEMILVAEGDITVTVEGDRFRLLKNQGLIVPPLMYHTVTANEIGNYRRITALFGYDGIPEVVQHRLTNRVSRFSHQPQPLQELCQKNDPSFYAPLAQSLMVQLFYDALQDGQSVVHMETDPFVQMATQYIDKHLHEKICLADVAKHTARSTSSFCRLFEKKMNITPKQYILQKKLALARKLIDEGVPRTAAAMQVGYDNYSSFYRLYSKEQKQME